jgi:hypothetical protein
VPLEAKFDRDDAFKGRTEMTKPEEYQEINVGTVISLQEKKSARNNNIY